MKKHVSKNTLFLVLIIMFVSLELKSQTHEFAPVGAEWYYSRIYKEGFNPTGVACDRFTSLRTVDINGLECKEIELYQHLDCDGIVNPHSELRYVYQDGDLIYEVEGGELYLLYDFSKEVGEYWIAPKYDNDTVFVNSIAYITLDDGTTRRVMETQSSNWDWWFGNIIEGIGREESLFPQLYLDGASCLEGPIRCYFEDGIQLISSETECDYEVQAVDEYDVMPLVFINTLVENVLHVSFANNATCQSIEIYSVDGRIVERHGRASLQTAIDISNLNPGVYILKVNMADGTVHTERIVKE